MDILKKLKSDNTRHRLIHNVFCVVAPHIPLKKIIIHEIIHKIFTIYILFQQIK